MGHTLVTRFDPAGCQQLRQLLEAAHIHGNNKIPFGRDCDRRAANAVLPYHITVCHWAKQDDERFLKALDSFVFRPCSVRLTSVQRLYGSEGSLLLYLAAEPGEGYADMAASLARVTRTLPAPAPHLTLAVSQDHDEIHRQAEALEAIFAPLTLRVVGLDLYHIWRPTRFVRTYGEA